MHKMPTRPEPTPAALKPLIEALCLQFHPTSIWLFGSRARGDNRFDSDWDILMALPDNSPDALLDPLLPWSIQRNLQVPATIVATTKSDLNESWGAPNTIGYDLAREGRLLHVGS